MQGIINVKNNDGKTALHVALIHNIQCDIVELLMSVPWIDLNICDADGMTPLDHLKQRPKSASSEILIKQLISAGGISNCEDYVARKALVTHLKTHGIETSPGTSFRIPDGEILLHTDIDNSFVPNYDQASVESNSCAGEISIYESASFRHSTKSTPLDYTSRRLKFLFQLHKRKERKEAASSEFADDDAVASFISSMKLEESPIPLRQRYVKHCSLPNNNPFFWILISPRCKASSIKKRPLRTFPIRTFVPSPSSKKYFAAGLMQGVIQVNKQKGVVDIMESSCSQLPMDDAGTVLELNYNRKGSFNKKLMNRYFSFGAQGQAVQGANGCTRTNLNTKSLSSLVASIGIKCETESFCRKEHVFSLKWLLLHLCIRSCILL